MSDDKMQLQRWELKYVIPETLALQARDFVSSYLTLDEYGVGKPNLSYTIHNLYLDSDDLRIYWGTINGDKNRYKLRLRFYDDNPKAPVFFEIKRRMNDAILKQRGGIKREAVEVVLSGMLPANEELVSGDPRQLVAIQRFVDLMIHDRASSRAHVTYQREAWISPSDNSVRVTFDREVFISPEFVTRFTSEMDRPTRVFGNLVILELKFTGRFPGWFNDLVRALGLRQGSASKYADGIATMGEHFFYPKGHIPSLQRNPAGSEERKMERLKRIDELSRKAFAA